MEEWKILVVWKKNERIDFDGHYLINKCGNIKAIEYVDTNGKIRKPKQIKPHYTRDGYVWVALSNKGKRIEIRVHRAVWETFIGKIPNGMQINHLNERKDDNRLENLSITSPKENVNWGTRTERASQTNSIVLKNRNDCSKTINQYDLQGHFIDQFLSTMEIERRYGFCHCAISYCCNGKQKTAYGYRWSYA